MSIFIFWKNRQKPFWLKISLNTFIPLVYMKTQKRYGFEEVVLKGKKNKTKKRQINKMEIVEKLKEFKTSGLSFLEKMPKDVLNEMIREANVEYHALVTTEEPPVLTDSE